MSRRYRVITTDDGKFQIQYWHQGWFGNHWTNLMRYEYCYAGTTSLDEIHPSLRAASAKVDMLISEDERKATAKANAGKVVYGPKP